MSQHLPDQKYYISAPYIMQLPREDKVSWQVLDIILLADAVGASAPTMNGVKSLHSLQPQDTLHIAQEKWP